MTILGTTQTLNAQRSVDSLKQLSVPKVKVIRNGVKQEINSEQLTVGDIIEFEAINRTLCIKRLCCSKYRINN